MIAKIVSLADHPEGVVEAMISGETFVGVGRTPGRRGWWLGKMTDGGWYPLAKFRDEAAATEFLALMNGESA